MRVTLLCAAVLAAATVSDAWAGEKSLRSTRLEDRAVRLCLDDDDCRGSLYCAKTPGNCDGPGVCMPPLPDELQCLDVWEPVCGCDGHTYSNTCYARRAGVNVDYEGECDNNYCSSNLDCAETEYCWARSCAAETGECMPRPQACPENWAPVCGCDGVTYANRCHAAAAGQRIDHRGPCDPGPCWSNDMCDVTQHCLFDGCAAETGTCVFRPQGCFDIWDPVCGCDSQTYSNACYAAMAGVTVDYEGECDPVYCWGNEMCAPDEYCFFHVCAVETGVCEPRPEACFDIWDPVCGCDGQTYSNACYAALAGMSVDYEGECDPVYCWGNEMCDPDEYCFFHVCAVETGVCEPRPEACLDIWDPVCGCDGQTYSNACYAALAAMSVDHPGPCDTSCLVNEDCMPGSYCAKLPGQCDGVGVCETLPPPVVQCLDVWDPVCGCDGQTHSNACYAHLAGINIDYEGPCLD